MPKKRKQHEEEHIDETWLIPYADLLTLLLALFIVLFAVSNIDQKKYDRLILAMNSAFHSGSGILEYTSAFPLEVDQPTESTEHRGSDTDKNIGAELKNLEELKKRVDRYIQENHLESEIETSLNKNLLMITIRDHALFDSGSAEVNPGARQLGVALSEMLVEYPGYEVVVAGHTDNRPIRTAQFESNWDLSTERALNFMKILLQNDQLNPGRFHAEGYGEFRPIATNETKEGRALNRRVEISIYKFVSNADKEQPVLRPLQK
ncbi:MAG: flagellar motor protein MotB [Bacillaceae bacterium]|nr:flagellar motor protein MotB [Bacillaceae bacterium]